MKEGYSNWRKLDNAALAFPLVTGKNDTRVFRFYCELKENVKPELLQAALEKTMEKYPLFQMVLRKGLFWFYLEHRDIRPIVKEEKKPPCSRLYIPDKKNLLFQVSYYEKRINFEVFHALTDGTGAMHFLQELVSNYLKKAHPEQDLPSLPVTDMSTPGDQEEDSFSQYYSSDIPGNSEKKPRAVRLPGERLLHEDMHITEIVLPVKELHAKAKEYGVSITILITAMFLCSIHEEIPKSRQNRPIALMVPVNLRNYFPSQSMANFFGWIEVGHDFSQTSDFTEILAHVKEQFAAELAFWIRHCKACRKISQQIGEALDDQTLCNIWIPDGLKDVPGDRFGLRERLRDSLDEIYAEKYDRVIDSCESKVFGIGLESMTVGSNEFYLAYAATHPGVYDLLDLGHFHPTENVADKLSALLLFFDKVPLHVTRPVRWDSDHVVLFDDPTKEVAMEIAHIPGAWEKVIIGLDFFDASINRVGAWATGTRAMEKSLLYALLQPGERLKELQDTYQFTEKMMLAEQAKSMPFGAVWDEYCRRAGCPLDGELYPAVAAYEAKVLPERM